MFCGALKDLTSQIWLIKCQSVTVTLLLITLMNWWGSLLFLQLANINNIQKVTELKGHSNENRGNAERLSEAYQAREREALELKTSLEESEEKRWSIFCIWGQGLRYDHFWVFKCFELSFMSCPYQGDSHWPNHLEYSMQFNSAQHWNKS